MTRFKLKACEHFVLQGGFIFKQSEKKSVCFSFLSRLLHSKKWMYGCRPQFLKLLFVSKINLDLMNVRTVPSTVSL